MCEILVECVEPFKSYHLIFLGGINLLLGGYMCPAIPIFELGRGIPVKSHVRKIWFGLVEPFKSYLVHKHFSGGWGVGQ